MTLAIGACINTPMKGYKRNQVEEAICIAMGVATPRRIAIYRSQAKRLLDADRTLAALEPKSSGHNHAFYSGGAPGKGADVQFSAYEAFALLTGLRFLDHGWPQGFVVRSLRAVRSGLEATYAHIMKFDRAAIFNKKSVDAAPCPFGSDNTRPSFLLVATGKSTDPDELDDRTTVTVCEDANTVSAYLRNHTPHSWTLLELTSSAHRLAQALSATLPRTRGRS